MKTGWLILCATLVVSATTLFGSEDSQASTPSTAVVSSQSKSLKEAWTVSSEPSRRFKTTRGVPNFGKLNNAVWRSGQPTREGYQTLAHDGLKTVVNLRKEFPQDKDLIPAGVKYVYIPIVDETTPTDEQAKLFIETVSNPENWPVLVHCHGGEGRAGIMSALVRHSFDGWDHSKIMQEVSNFRVKIAGLFKTSMPGHQVTFIRHWEETPILFEAKTTTIASKT